MDKLTELKKKIQDLRIPSIEERKNFFISSNGYRFPKKGLHDGYIAVFLPRKNITYACGKKKQKILSANEVESMFGFWMGQEIDLVTFREIIGVSNG